MKITDILIQATRKLDSVNRQQHHNQILPTASFNFPFKSRPISSINPQTNTITIPASKKSNRIYIYIYLYITEIFAYSSEIESEPGRRFHWGRAASGRIAGGDGLPAPGPPLETRRQNQQNQHASAINKLPATTTTTTTTAATTATHTPSPPPPHPTSSPPRHFPNNTERAKKQKKKSQIK